jgi:hypothetical protein
MASLSSKGHFWPMLDPEEKHLTVKEFAQLLVDSRDRRRSLWNMEWHQRI